ncbi:polysaccharide biosynthesis protein [Pseudactinotalea terrae]|uniref:polysaccharide biosynthesis protein n=1 Tax=Pseudactinotalea terrae TaxID=1743262 RepID=UPI001F4F2DF1|nr:nucleoside-diphosphate sugar epimerase/dehydratase [Pseudactinotalea terrae]
MIRTLYLRGRIAQVAPQVAVDLIVWAIAVPLAVWLRFEFRIPAANNLGIVVVMAATLLLQVVFGLLFSLYRGRYSYGSFDEVVGLTSTVAATAVAVGVPMLFWGPLVGAPRSTMLIATPIAFVAMAASRYLKRLALERGQRPGEHAHATLVYGAGAVGSQLVRSMRTDPESAFRAVGIVDDAPQLRGAIRHGVPVLGSLEDLEDVVERTDATHLVVAIARADAAFLRQVNDRAMQCGLQVLVMPPFSDVLAGRRQVKDLRSISIEDIVGRHPVDTDVASIAGYLRGRRVLVTGAGGSIGAELCRQVADWEPSELIMLDRDESALQQVQLLVHGHGLLSTPEVVLADIRDAETIVSLFRERQPEVVFHAAALKHLPMLEQYPAEAWKTNVVGSLNVLRAAEAAGVETFVNISTDKAANPTSVLGHSKRVAERLTASFADSTKMRYLSVRFGNVLGSRGSMVPTFASLIDAGGPLTVTHPDITRYFMSIPEACQLVIQAGAIGSPAEVLILDMGEPVRILDIAKRMISMSGKRIEIVFTGLRPHEKLHEDLVSVDEAAQSMVHPKISHATVPPLAPEDLDRQRWDSHWRREHSADVAHEQTEVLGSATAPIGPLFVNGLPVR